MARLSRAARCDTSTHTRHRQRRKAVVETDTPLDNADHVFAPGSDDLVVTLYGELRKIAHREHFRAGMPQTMQTTALIGEAYVRLQRRKGWEGPAHFLGCAATAMRHVLIDLARTRLAAKRAGPVVSYEDGIASADEDAEVIRLGEALTALARFDPELARLVECRFFAGYSERETAEALGVSDRTVRRRWIQARAWIHDELAAV